MIDVQDLCWYRIEDLKESFFDKFNRFLFTTNNLALQSDVYGLI